ncbi:hypothetical protein SBC1_53900 (plasmid) [Caballeronia sp. SBC1]|nr:hypothetical protein SBC1_53900 [Caballeronia sp. SBC1]
MLIEVFQRLPKCCLGERPQVRCQQAAMTVIKERCRVAGWVNGLRQIKSRIKQDILDLQPVRSEITLNDRLRFPLIHEDLPRVKQDESRASIRMRVLALRQRWRA